MRVADLEYDHDATAVLPRSLNRENVKMCEMAYVKAQQFVTPGHYKLNVN